MVLRNALRLRPEPPVVTPPVVEVVTPPIIEVETPNDSGADSEPPVVTPPIIEVETPNDSDADKDPKPSGADKLPINGVQTVAELLPLPGIGTNRAEAILAHRPDSGYADMADLKKRVGFEMATTAWAKIEAVITFEEPPAA